MQLSSTLCMNIDTSENTNISLYRCYMKVNIVLNNDGADNTIFGYVVYRPTLIMEVLQGENSML